jgi:PBSX family phage terminase large subunit
MYYDTLRRRVMAAKKYRQAITTNRADILDSIAPAYIPLHDDIIRGDHSIYHLPGGRGSAKSSFVSLEIVDGMMKDPAANAVVFRRTANTLRDSCYSQIAWAIDELGASSLWRGNVSPMQFTYLPTGQQIIFRGVDDAGKLKSLKPRRGYFRFIWFEEFSEMQGANTVRNVMQSVMRGADDFICFNTFNPPISLNNWANKHILLPDDRATVFKTTYEMIPPEWLGSAFIAEAERLREINENAYRHEYLGEAIGTGGEVFPNLQAREITDAEIDQLQYIYSGCDFGFAQDPMAYIRAAYDEKHDTIYLIDEIYKKHMSNKQLADEIKRRGYDSTGRYSHYASPMMGFTSSEIPATVICDCAEPKSVADLQNEGIKAIACRKFAGCVQYRIKWLQQRRIIIDPKRTPNAWREFSSYEYEVSKDGEILSDLPDRDNHTIDSLAYALDRIIYRRGVSA